MAETVKTIRLITIIRKSDNIKILDAACVDSLSIEFYTDRIDLEFEKDSIIYNMHIKEASNFKIIIE